MCCIASRNDAKREAGGNTEAAVDPLMYRLAFEQTDEYAMFLLGTDGRVITWNAGGQRIQGYAPEEIIGRHFSIFHTREAVDRGLPAHELKVAAEEGSFEDEGWRVCSDGSIFWASVVITALRGGDDGRLLGYANITRDFTDRKLAVEALRQSEEQFSLLLEGVVDYAIFMLDPHGIVRSWNSGAQRINGYSRDEIVGKDFSCLYSPEDASAGIPGKELAQARRHGRVETEAWHVRKNGERFWARVVLTGLYDPEGRLRGFAKVTQDLTERKRMDTELEEKNKELARALSTTFSPRPRARSEIL